MIDQLIQFDQLITAQIVLIIPQNAFFDALFSFFSLRGLTVVIWIILFGFFWYQEHKDKTQHHFFFAFVTSFGITSFLVNIVLKNIIQRTRPWIEQGILESTCPSNYSFPSGHASSAFAGAVVFAYFDKKRKWLYYGIATCIALSRIYLGCHYGFDVMIGALIGFFIGKATIKLLTSRKML